jgi:hypothetical protein
MKKPPSEEAGAFSGVFCAARTGDDSETDAMSTHMTARRDCAKAVSRKLDFFIK